jgi:hypothetical protein
MNKQQIIGSLAYWFSQNPSSMLAFYNSYNDGNQWYSGTTNPTTIRAINSYYLNTVSGDVWQVLVITTTPTWIKINNLQSKTCNQSKNIDFTAINGGTSPQTTIDIPLISLGRNEVINEIDFECISAFTSSDSTIDLAVSIFDTTNNFKIVEISNLNNPGQNESTPNVFANECYISNLINIHPLTPTLIVARFTATDLTKLNAGNCNLYFPTSFYPAP